MTQVRNGSIMQGGRTLLSRADLHDAARADPILAQGVQGEPFRVYVTSFAWLDDLRLVASLDIEPTRRGPLALAAVFDRRAVTTVTTSFLGPFDQWVVSPSGAYTASSNGTIIARDGRSADPPPSGLPAGQAVAFSPDNRWLAYVSGFSTFLIGTPLNDEPGRIIRLPIAAQDLVWQPVTSGTSPTVGG